MSYKFTIYEGGEAIDLDNYSGQEIESLEEAILKLVASWRENDVVIDFTKGTINIEHPKWLDKEYQICPRQFGLTPWSKITVRFSPFI